MSQVAAKMTSSTVLANLVHTIGSHTSDVNGVAFSSDGKLATCSADKTIRVWDTEDFTELSYSPLCGHTYYVHCCAFSPFSTLIASCSTDGKLILWDVKNGTKVAVLQHESQNSIRVCKFSPNSSYVVTGSDDEMLCLWDVSTKKLVRCFQGHESSVVACAFTPDSNFVVSGSTGGDLKVWDAKYGHGKFLAFVLECHDLGVTCCDFSPTFGSANCYSDDGSVHFLLATSGQDNLVKLWDFTAITGAGTAKVTAKFKLDKHTASVMGCDLMFDVVDPLAAVDKGSKVKQLDKWSVDEVCKWLEEIELSEYVDSFKDNHIDGTELLGLDQMVLQTSLGVSSLGHRNKILRARTDLSEKCAIQIKKESILLDGYTYERSAIKSWMDSGKNRSPMTNSILATKQLTPNRSLKMLIQRFKQH
ncbi:hypothetical protein KUTeg_015061 [Tegillarca granosa]|uniref:WD repeat, SAM and U-box domain-containing protein 1 n=1 Tax=Tegillarca granosa TaxID=220873 RepID=A0ABQ9ESP5_TEGGR|nr:hypothetical protein KUTeg_015061 [Tegillarca granosa]